MPMVKLINAPESFVEEVLEGVLTAHRDQVKRGSDPRSFVRADAPIKGKVAIATGGGSGHLPAFMGYVGKGLADGASVGNVFASPSAEQMLAVTRDIDGDAGVLYIYGNYSGDRMNFELAAELADGEGIEVKSIRAADDIASAPPTESHRRRGIAGIFFLYKVAGARTEEGATLDQVYEVTRRAAENLRSMGVAIAPCTVPAAGRPTFSLDAGEMEIGMGLHGEPGVRHGALEPADAIADQIIDALLGDLKPSPGDQLEVLVNGLGATPSEELYIIFGRCHSRLQKFGYKVRRAWVGEYATSLEMAGASISILRTDPELARLLDAPMESPFMVRR